MKQIVPVRVIGDHPWAGENGVIEFIDGKTTTASVLGGEAMLLVTLSGNNGQCYAPRRNLRIIGPAEPT